MILVSSSLSFSSFVDESSDATLLLIQQYSSNHSKKLPFVLLQGFAVAFPTTVCPLLPLLSSFYSILYHFPHILCQRQLWKHLPFCVFLNKFCYICLQLNFLLYPLGLTCFKSLNSKCNSSELGKEVRPKRSSDTVYCSTFFMAILSTYAISSPKHCFCSLDASSAIIKVLKINNMWFSKNG